MSKVTELKSGLKLVDHRCFCEACESRTKETYELSVSCYNCGENHVAIFRKGDRHGPMDDCPFCEVSGQLTYGTSKEAEKLRTASRCSECGAEVAKSVYGWRCRNCGKIWRDSPADPPNDDEPKNPGYRIGLDSGIVPDGDPDDMAAHGIQPDKNAELRKCPGCGCVIGHTVGCKEANLPPGVNVR